MAPGDGCYELRQPPWANGRESVSMLGRWSPVVATAVLASA